MPSEYHLRPIYKKSSPLDMIAEEEKKMDHCCDDNDDHHHLEMEGHNNDDNNNNVESTGTPIKINKQVRHRKNSPFMKQNHISMNNKQHNSKGHNNHNRSNKLLDFIKNSILFNSRNNNNKIFTKRCITIILIILVIQFLTFPNEEQQQGPQISYFDQVAIAHNQMMATSGGPEESYLIPPPPNYKVPIPKKREDRFPSIEERVKLYMSNWYLPPCASSNNNKSNNDDNNKQNKKKSKKRLEIESLVGKNNNNTDGLIKYRSTINKRQDLSPWLQTIRIGLTNENIPAGINLKKNRTLPVLTIRNVIEPDTIFLYDDYVVNECLQCKSKNNTNEDITVHLKKQQPQSQSLKTNETQKKTDAVEKHRSRRRRRLKEEEKKKNTKNKFIGTSKTDKSDEKSSTKKKKDDNNKNDVVKSMSSSSRSAAPSKGISDNSGGVPNNKGGDNDGIHTQFTPNNSITPNNKELVKSVEYCRNMLTYCIDVSRSIKPLLENHKELQFIPQEDRNRYDSTIPILLQFGDMSHSHKFGNVNIPIIKKFRSGIYKSIQSLHDVTSTSTSTSINIDNSDKEEEEVVKEEQCYDDHHNQRPMLQTNHNNNQHSSSQQQIFYSPIIWKLEVQRHYGSLGTIKELDTIPWHKKKDMAIFRGQLTGAFFLMNPNSTDYDNCALMARCQFVLDNNNSTLVDAKLTSTRGYLPNTIYGNDNKNTSYNIVVKKIQKDVLMSYKAIIMIEGNDVSSGLKWSLLSSSVVMMPKPKYTSWTMEELLVPWIHYIPLKDDMSDVVTKMEWVLNNDKLAQHISRRATLWIEDLILSDQSSKDDVIIQNSIISRYKKHFIHEMNFD